MQVHLQQASYLCVFKVILFGAVEWGEVDS